MTPERRRTLLRVVQLVFVVAVFAYGGRQVAAAWREAGVHAGDRSLLALRWIPLVLATGVVYATYLLLVQLWRFVLRAWQTRLGLADALHIFFVSSLGRYVPGRVAQIAAMAVMARQRGVSAAAATGSSVLNTLLNVAAGLLVAVALTGSHLERIQPGARMVAYLLLGAALLGTVGLPWLLPRAVSLAARLTRRSVAIPVTPPVAVYATFAGNVVAWLLYGLAFRLFTAGILGEAAGATTSYVAVYTLSYVAGYLALFTPGGLGVREYVMATGLTVFGLTGSAEAWLLAFASRLWLLVLEIVPGVVLLAHAAVRPRPPVTSGDAPL